MDPALNEFHPNMTLLISLNAKYKDLLAEIGSLKSICPNQLKLYEQVGKDQLELTRNVKKGDLEKMTLRELKIKNGQIIIPRQDNQEIKKIRRHFPGKLSNSYYKFCL